MNRYSLLARALSSTLSVLRVLFGELTSFFACAVYVSLGCAMVSSAVYPGLGIGTGVFLLVFGVVMLILRTRPVNTTAARGDERE